MSKAVNLRSFKQQVRYRKTRYRRFLGRLEKNPPKGIHNLTMQVDATVWEETDCLSCGNCCKTMTPTFTPKDIKRIAAHLNMTIKEFKVKWLYYDKKDKDWMNTKQPCQFLNLKDNKCSIYAVRPADCAGFPHHTKKKFTDYAHVFQQNVAYCPATLKFVEKLMEAVQKK